jgi:hypothetical protein
LVSPFRSTGEQRYRINAHELLILSAGSEKD